MLVYKRPFLTVLILALCLLAACGGGKESDNDDTPAAPTDTATGSTTPDFEEDFDDEIADGWRTDGGAWGIQDNRYDVQDNADANVAWSYYPSLDASHYSIQADLQLVTENYRSANARTAGVAVRMADTAHGYYAALNWKEQTLTLTTPQQTIIEDATLEPDTWYTLRLVARGPYLRVYLDDELQLEAADGEYPDGYVGLSVDGGHFQIDNVSVAPVSPPDTGFDLPFEDDFQDGDSDNWWKFNGKWRTVDGELTQHYDGAGDVWAYHTGVANNYRVRMRVLPVGDDGRTGIAIRMQQINTGYWGLVDWDTHNLSIFRRENSNWYRLAQVPLSTNLDTNTWHTLSLQAAGQYLRLQLDDLPPIEATDDTYTGGYFALWTNRTAANFDDVIVQEVEAATTAAELPFTDNFDDDGLQGWLVDSGGWGVQAGVLNQGNIAVDSVSNIWVDVPGQDYAVTFRARLVSDMYTDEHDRVIGPVVRRRDDGYAYAASVNVQNGTARLWYGNDEVGWSPISESVSIDFDTDDWNTLRLEAYQEQIRFRFNGDLVINATDERSARGGFGIRVREGHFEIDNVRAEEIDR